MINLNNVTNALKNKEYNSIIIALDQYINSALNFALPFIFAKLLGEEQFNQISHLIIFFGLVNGLTSASYVFILNYSDSKKIDYFPKRNHVLIMVLISFLILYILHQKIDDIFITINLVGIYVTNIITLVARKKIYLDGYKNLITYSLVRIMSGIIGLLLIIVGQVIFAMWIIVLPCLLIIYFFRTDEDRNQIKSSELFITKHVYHFVFSYLASTFTLYTYATILAPNGLGELRLIQTLIGGGAILVAPLESIFSWKYKLHTNTKKKYLPGMVLKFYIYSISTLALICAFVLLTVSWLLPWLNITLLTATLITLSWCTGIFIIVGTVRERAANRIKKLFSITLINQISALLFLFLAIDIEAPAEVMYTLGVLVGFCISSIVLQNYSHS